MPWLEQEKQEESGRIQGLRAQEKVRELVEDRGRAAMFHVGELGSNWLWQEGVSEFWMSGWDWGWGKQWADSQPESTAAVWTWRRAFHEEGFVLCSDLWFHCFYLTPWGLLRDHRGLELGPVPPSLCIRTAPGCERGIVVVTHIGKLQLFLKLNLYFLSAHRKYAKYFIHMTWTLHGRTVNPSHKVRV